MSEPKFVRNLPEWSTDAKLWSLGCPPPGKEYRYIITSAVRVFGAPETYIFPGTPAGYPISMVELPGSFKGALDHEEAIRGFVEWVDEQEERVEINLGTPLEAYRQLLRPIMRRLYILPEGMAVTDGQKAALLDSIDLLSDPEVGMPADVLERLGKLRWESAEGVYQELMAIEEGLVK